MTEAPAEAGQPTPETAETPAPEQEERTFTQKDVNKLAGSARKEARTAFLNDLGFEKPEELKAFVEEYRSVQEATKTEADRLREDLETYKPKAERAETLEETLKGYLEREREGVPEHIIPLLDKMDVVDQLAYLSENKANLVPQEEQRPRINAPQTAGTTVSRPNGQTPEELQANWLLQMLGGQQ